MRNEPFMIFNSGNASIDLDPSLLEESDEDVDLLCQWSGGHVNYWRELPIPEFQDFKITVERSIKFNGEFLNRENYWPKVIVTVKRLQLDTVQTFLWSCCILYQLFISLYIGSFYRLEDHSLLK